MRRIPHRVPPSLLALLAILVATAAALGWTLGGSWLAALAALAVGGGAAVAWRVVAGPGTARPQRR